MAKVKETRTLFVDNKTKPEDRVKTIFLQTGASLRPKLVTFFQIQIKAEIEEFIKVIFTLFQDKCVLEVYRSESHGEQPKKIRFCSTPEL
ncbi:unnamed protein product [Eruca vesicaria subsp. sativa]|uniref:Uncharacterized protein n=1 Tax=Eruca vesicaria subsp. sativa TaxID=29727 RepID=A0ABC8K195_ERUVS|nr:unnamed protein product [Eruca vesicaria subsp. sativa]